jgi:hypothetical protein
MSWRDSLGNAIAALRKEEQRLERELSTLRDQIARLSGARGSRKAPAKRRMSAEGRAAISRAAKKRWAAWRKAKGRGK